MGITATGTAYAWLACAIMLEVIGTSALKAAEGFTRPLPSLLVAIGYTGAFICLSFAIRTIPMGIAYAIWSGVGIVAISAFGWIAYRQALDMPALVGIAMILAGVLVINLFSRSIAH